MYVEYWGYENEPEYAARKKVKQELYQKYELNLIELNDEHIKNLDDYLPKMLLKFGIIVSRFKSAIALCIGVHLRLLNKYL
ncbi:hypothetical protein [Microcoleus sp.]|uniref:hypothetical protein n=1 Tax=Microcoleus sp. TaxID=44472 RepID=UPI003526A7C7